MSTEEVPLNKKVSSTFRHDVIKELLKSKFANAKNKITDDSIELITEIAKAMVVEAAARACHQAKLEDRTVVGLEQVECVLPQMMLDFP